MSLDRYALFGQAPSAIAIPATIAEARDSVCAASGTSIIPWGGGTRQHVGYAPQRYDLALSTERLIKITHYSPPDMTIAAEAGLTVAALQQVLAEQGQWLPLDVAAPDRQTVGGIVATRADSLRRFSFGSVRDALIGVNVLNARGELIKGGGRVVKNVSGYDLPKMYCGSWGTLGLIVEATFKVAPLPEASATIALPLDADHNSEDVLDSLLASEIEPTFLYLLNPSAAKELVADAADAQYMVIGFDGAAPAVAWQVETLGAPVLQEGKALRARLRDFSLSDAPMTAKFHILSSQVGAFARMVDWTARRAGFSARVVGDAAVGMLWAHFAPDKEDADWHLFYADLKDKADRVGGSFIIERMPESLRERDTPVWSPILSDFALMRGLKNTLDPDRMWNSGRFVGRL